MHRLNRPEEARSLFVSSFAVVLALSETPELIAVDIPIGLPDRTGPGGRACDVEARRQLGARKSSIFSVPARSAVGHTDYVSACNAALKTSDPPRKISKQVFYLFAKIREVDELMTPELQNRVVECHPERVFQRLNGGTALNLPKKMQSKPHIPGLTQRRQLLTKIGYRESLLHDVPCRRANAGEDDLIDACANAAAAADIVRGLAGRVPASPGLDRRGLRMEIWG